MALFKISKGLKVNLPSAKTAGYCWYTIDDSLFYIDYEDENGVVQRQALNAKDAETLTGASLATILNSSDFEIPTSQAVLTALSDFATNDSVTGVQNALQANIDTHTENTNNPHGVTVTQIGAATADHKHDAATDITSGILPISRGGTGNNSGYVRVGQKADTTIGTKATVEGYNNTADGDYSHAEGSNNYASGSNSHAEGKWTSAAGDWSHAEGNTTKTGGTSPASLGVDNPDPGLAAHAEGYGSVARAGYSHAEGTGTVAEGVAAHAEGYSTKASGEASHAEGNRTKATGVNAHAEGKWSTASGDYSHAEGFYTTASGMYSHAAGYHTTASSDYQHVIGRWNSSDSSGTYAVIVGNGDPEIESRSNAHTLDWSGNAWFKGNIYVGGYSQSSGTMVASTASVTTAEYETMSLNNELNESTLYMLTDDTSEEDLQATVNEMNNIDYEANLAFDVNEIV